MAVHSSSAVEVCIICLDTDSQLYLLSEYNLEDAYEKVTGLSLQNGVKLKPTLCTECAYRLTKCYSFRKKTLRAHTLLLELVKDDELLSIHKVKTVNRENNQLTSNLVKRVYEPNYHDLHIIDSEDDKKIELENTIYKVELKYEKSDHITPVVKSLDETINNHILNDENLKFDDEYPNDDIDFDDDTDNNVDYSNVINLKNGFHNKLSDTKNVYYVEFVNDNDSEVEILDDKFKTKQSVNNVLSKNYISSHIINKPKQRKNIQKRVRKKPEVSNKKPTINLKLFKITKLTYEQQLAEVQQRQESEKYKKSKFKCTLCFKGFANENAHSTHMVTHSDVCGEVTCALCSKHFEDRKRLLSHLNCAHYIRYTCTSCGFVCKQRPQAVSHERQHLGTRYKCRHCDENFNAASAYNQHLHKRHPSGDIDCALCGDSFKTSGGKLLHTKVKHRFDNTQNLEGPECIPCNVRFASDAAYSRHMTVSPKHNAGIVKGRPINVDYVTCNECGLEVKGMRLYTLHLRRSHPETYSLNVERYLCDLCGQSYKHESSLNQHMKVSHQELEGEYQCDVCAKTFNLKSKLAVHMYKHRDKPDKKTYTAQCTICTKRFSNINGRNLHIKQIHTNRRFYECPICHKNFSSSTNRDRHKWIHKGKTFQCDTCDKLFATLYEKRGHMLHVHMNKPWPKRNRGPRAKPRQFKLEDTNTTRGEDELLTLSQANIMRV